MTIIDRQIEFFEGLEHEEWYQNLLKEFATFSGVEKSMKVLDVGCGLGALSHILAGVTKEVVGVESYPPLIERAAAKAHKAGLSNLSFQLATSPSLPFPAENFDEVVSIALLACVPDPKAVLMEMARVARAGGTIAALNPAVKMSPPMALRYAHDHGLPEEAASQMMQLAGVLYTYRHFTPEAIALLCEECGLKESQLESKADGMIIFAKGKKAG